MATIEITLGRAAALLTAIGVFAGAGAAFGWRFTSPGERIDSFSFVHDTLRTRVGQVESELAQHAVEQGLFRDTVMKALRPLNIALCLDRSPRETALMDLDCDSIIGAARNAALMNGRTIKARP